MLWTACRGVLLVHGRCVDNHAHALNCQRAEKRWNKTEQTAQMSLLFMVRARRAVGDLRHCCFTYPLLVVATSEFMRT